MAKKYEGSCYIAVVGSVFENGPCRDSIEAIKREKKDTKPQYIRATKGFEARQMHLNKWYNETKHPFILFLDADMIFPENTLGRLRANKLPYVSGFYMRRTIRPVYPVWFEQGAVGEMPLKPMTAVFEKNRLYPIGASGWGCVLIHRDVVKAVKKVLKGEPEIIEDDMDLYPYDLPKLIAARNLIEHSLKGNQIEPDKAKEALMTIIEEIRPLRGVKDNVGSDIRFPFYAQIAGFPLVGDTGVLCEHVADYPISIDDWLAQPSWATRDISLHIEEENRNEAERLRKAVER